MKLTDPEMLKALMRRRGVSYADLGRSAGVSKGFISHLLSPLPRPRKTTCTPQVAQRIAERLDVDLELLFVPSVSPTEGQSIARSGREAA